MCIGARRRTGPTDTRHSVRAQVNRLTVVVGVLVVLPLVVVVGRVRPGAGRRVARRGATLVATLCGVRFATLGRPGPGGSVVVANHSSPMDIPALLWADPDVRFLAAADLFRVPLLASAMRAIGTLPIDRRDHDRATDQLDRMTARGAAGGPDDLVVFAEGGIAPPGRMLPFKTGAFVLAIRAARPVLPVAIRGSDRVLAPHGRLLVRPGVVTVEFLDPVATVGLTIDDRHVLRDHVQAVVRTAADAA